MQLTKSFVLATDEVWRLQGGNDPRVYRARGGSDPECLLFQDMAGKGHAGPGAGSKQGIYVCTPGGKFLASINSNNPRNVARILRRGLGKWRRLSGADQTVVANPTPQHRFEWSAPKDGLRLTATLRHLPTNDDPSTRRRTEHNHDYLWFSKSEARELLPKSLEKGAKHTLSAKLFRRIACLNLVDAVRGETRPFRAAEGTIETVVTAVDETTVTIRIAGKTRALGTPRRGGLFVPLGIKAQLLGNARFDRQTGQFEAFELVGKGISWYESYGRRSRRSEPGGATLRTRPIGWFFTLTPKRKDGFYVAPTHLSSYGTAWSRRSAR